MFALLPDKKRKTCDFLFGLVWCSFWSPKMIKFDFETAVKSAINRAFPCSIITGCNFNFNQCLWRQIQTIRLNGGMQSEQVQITCRICAALVHLFINKAEVRLMIMENIRQNEKLTKFIDYYLQQWMENQNVPNEMWNTNKHRRRSNNATEGWNSKLSSIIG
jgi:hypothetical protein